MPNEFEAETETYNRLKPELIAKFEGKFVLIKGKELVGVYDTPDAAYADGLRRLGNVPMLIKGVQREEQSLWIPALQLGLIHADLRG